VPRAQRTKSAVHEALQRRASERPGDGFSVELASTCLTTYRCKLMVVAARNSPSRVLSRASDPVWYEPILEFAGHIIGGTAIFVLIAGAAWLLHEVTTRFSNPGTFVHYCLMIVEYAVVVADVLLFLLFVGRTFWRAATKLIRGWTA
jgi:hypothetical protein